MTKLKFGIISAIAVMGVAPPLVIQYQAQIQLRDDAGVVMADFAVGICLSFVTGDTGALRGMTDVQ